MRHMDKTGTEHPRKMFTGKERTENTGVPSRIDRWGTRLHHKLLKAVCRELEVDPTGSRRSGNGGRLGVRKKKGAAEESRALTKKKGESHGDSKHH